MSFENVWVVGHFFCRFGTGLISPDKTVKGKLEEQKRKSRAERSQLACHCQNQLWLVLIPNTWVTTMFIAHSQIIGNLLGKLWGIIFCHFSGLGSQDTLQLMRQRRRLDWKDLHTTPTLMLWKKKKERQEQSGQRLILVILACIGWDPAEMMHKMIMVISVIVAQAGSLHDIVPFRFPVTSNSSSQTNGEAKSEPVMI